MEKLVIMLFVLLLVVFAGNILYKESFADCNSAGQMTWTVTLNPGSSSCGRSMNVRDASGNMNMYDGRDANSLNSGLSGLSGLSGSGSSGSGSSGSGSSGSSSSGSSSSGSSSNQASPKKPSGIELSLTDLMALIGSTKDSSGNCPKPAYNYRYASASVPAPPAPPAAATAAAPQVYVIAGPPSKSLNSQFPSNLRTNTLDPLLGSYSGSGSLGGYDLQDNRIPAGSLATRQGVQYVKGAPSNNPVAEQPSALLSVAEQPSALLLAENPEYIRKDSIPCYACSL